ncbi:MAG TPA: cyclic nucleotide-binding domain-containing protein [Burkholderiales bacterium]|nr:cyclic nucleotide-binding domain-containing protein [Burkholderiales bacterium]
MEKNLLNELSPDDCSRLLALGHLHETTAGEELTRQGTVGYCLYVVESGELAVVCRVPGNEEEILETVRPGTLVGELAVLDRRPRSASLRAQRPGVVRIIDLRSFEALALEGGASGYRILRVVAASVYVRLQASRMAVAARVRNAAAAMCMARAPAQELSWLAASQEVARVLGELPAFSGLGEGEIAPLARKMETATVPKDTELLLPPCPEAAATLLIRGAVSPCLQVGEGLAISLPVVAPGGFIDYTCVLDQSDSCFWRTRSQSIVARIPAQVFGADADSGARLLYALCRDMANALRSTTSLAMHLGMTWDESGLRASENRRSRLPA